MSQERTPQKISPGPAPEAARFQRLAGLRLGLDLTKNRLAAMAKRAGLHFLALVAAAVLADGNNRLEEFFFLYLGVICLLPRGFSPRRNSHIFPGATALGQLALTLLMGYPLPLAVFLAGTQSWLQRAVIRRFRLGLDWLPAPFLLGFFVQAARGPDAPLAFFGLTFVCGLGAYYAARALDKRKQASLEAKARAKAGAASPYAHFYLSADELEDKARALPEGLQTRVADIALYGRNILDAMSQDQAYAQPGARFLGRYLPAGHKIVDEYIRLGKEGRGHQDIEAVLGGVDDILERLAQAFQQERGSLLRNDAMQLDAELKVLDKLLKMDGR